MEMLDIMLSRSIGTRKNSPGLSGASRTDGRMGARGLGARVRGPTFSNPRFGEGGEIAVLALDAKDHRMQTAMRQEPIISNIWNSYSSSLDCVRS